MTIDLDGGPVSSVGNAWIWNDRMTTAEPVAAKILYLSTFRELHFTYLATLKEVTISWLQKLTNILCDIESAVLKREVITNSQKNLRKFHGLVLGSVGLIDAKGIEVAQPIWLRDCPTQAQKQAKTGKKCIFCVFRLFLRLRRTASRLYRLSYINVLCTNQS